MVRIRVLPSLVSLFIMVGCNDHGTEPGSQHPATLHDLSPAAPTQAAVVNLHFVSVATGVDNGPQDGSLDLLSALNRGAVNNNGFTSFRTAFEFSLSDLPAGATIDVATLTVVLGNAEGTRSLRVLGYAGDGTVQLSDFALDGLVGTASVNPGTHSLVFDATAFIADLAANGASFAGFSIQEAPANPGNFLVMSLALDNVPGLSIGFSTAATVNTPSQGGVGRTVLLFTEMRSALEVPACNSASKGHAQIKVFPDGTIKSTESILNRGDESVRFGHIHHLNPTGGTGPIIWWLTGPIGVDLNLTARQLDFQQLAVFVTNPHYTTEDAARSALLNSPGDFYVNFHSDLCPGGFARGFLQVWGASPE